jgi:hypothetical protein
VSVAVAALGTAAAVLTLAVAVAAAVGTAEAVVTVALAVTAVRIPEAGVTGRSNRAVWTAESAITVAVAAVGTTEPSETVALTGQLWGQQNL